MSRLTTKLAAQAEAGGGRLSAEIAVRMEDCARLGTENTRSTEVLAAREVEKAADVDEAAHLKAGRAQLAEQVAARETELSRQNAQAREIQRRFADNSRRLQAREHELSRTVAELEESRRAVMAMRESWSWRLTAPFRAVVDVALTIQRLVGGTGNDVSFHSKTLGYLQWLWYGRQVRSSGLFDDRYYLDHNPDVAQSKGGPLRHFFVFGAAEARNPHPLFDLQYYFERNPDVVKSQLNPLVHYLKFGASEGRDPHPAFDTSFYCDRNPDVRKTGLNPLSHYMGPGVSQGLDPNPWFDTSEYLERNPNVALNGINPLVNYLETRNAPWIRESMRSGNASLAIPATPGESTDLPLGMLLDPRTTELRARLRTDYEALCRPPLNSDYDSIPLVSAVIPCYNCGYYLEDAILSAMMACTYPMEIIVVDDGSTDQGQISAVDELAERYHFRLLRQAHAGRAGARNTGVRNSRGKFIQFLDADDILAPGKIDFQSDMMTHDANLDIAVCEYELCAADGSGRRLMEPSTLAGFAFTSEDFLVRWERGFSLPIDCALFRREILDGERFPTAARAGKEDWIFWIVVASAAPRFHFHPEVLATSRVHGLDTVTSREDMGLDFLRACMYVLQAELNTCDDFLEKSIDHFYKSYLGSVEHEAIVWPQTRMVK